MGFMVMITTGWEYKKGRRPRCLRSCFLSLHFLDRMGSKCRSLPAELWLQVFKFMGSRTTLKDWIAVERTCREWRDALKRAVWIWMQARKLGEYFSLLDYQFHDGISRPLFDEAIAFVGRYAEGEVNVTVRNTR